MNNHIGKRMVEKFKCSVCGHEWLPRTTKPPYRCTNMKCQSPYWQDEPSKKSSPIINKQEPEEAKQESKKELSLPD